MKKNYSFKTSLIALMLLMTVVQVNAQAPEVTLISPDEANIEWTIGETHLISWTDNIQTNVEVLLHYTDISNDPQVITLTGASGVEGSTWNWNTATWNAANPDILVDGNTYKIEVRSVNINSINDVSDSPFTFVSSASTTEIHVEQPNIPGIKWGIGSTHIISWTDNIEGDLEVILGQFTTTGSYIKILSATESGIDDTPTSESTISWTIPSTIDVTKRYKVAVRTSDGSYKDWSDNTFEITAGDPSSEITVISPEGGEAWQVGTKHLISWTDNLEEGVDIYITWDGGEIQQNIDGPITESTWEWTIPDNYTINYDFKISVRSSVDSNIEGESPVFTLTDTDPEGVITVLYPNDGEIWVQGTTHLISWTDNIEGKVEIFTTWGDGSHPDKISPAGGVEGTTWNWNINENYPVGTYLIRVTSLDGLYTDDSENTFAIAATDPLDELLVLQPAVSGIQWAKGTNHLISWTDNIDDDIDIYLVDPSNSETLIDQVSNVTTYSWDIDANQTAATGYKLKFYRAGTTDLLATSIGFEITSSNPAWDIDVIYPDGGETLVTGNTYLVSWVDNIDENVIVTLRDGAGNLIENIVASPGTDESTADWTISTSTAGDYKVRVESINDPAVYDESDATFAISNIDPDLFITVLSPNGGEAWYKGSTHLISWTDNIDGTFIVKLSQYDAGGNWVYTFTEAESGIDQTPTSESTLSWTIPNNAVLDPSYEYRVSVRTAPDGDYIDVSDDNFTLLPYVLMSAYPNPANQSFTLSVGNTIKGKYTVELYDRYNNRVMETVGNTQASNKMEISTSELSDGIYFMIVTSNNERTTKKIVISHK